jgi:hypothetical protein
MLKNDFDLHLNTKYSPGQNGWVYLARKLFTSATVYPIGML